MEIKHYEKPEIEIVEIADADVLATSMNGDWAGSGSTDHGGYPWLP